MKRLAFAVLGILVIVSIGWFVYRFSAAQSAPPATATPWPSETVMVSAAPTIAQSATPQPSRPHPTASPVSTPTPTEAVSPQPPPDPFALISQDSLFGYMEDLTAIQPHSGWRNSASEGEAEAIDYVELKLGEFGHLQSLGMQLERQEFRVFLGTELRETRLHVLVDGREVELPADGLRGPRDDIAQALRFDSDGRLNDSTPDPVVIEGPVVVVRSADDIEALQTSDVSGVVVFLDYAVIDRILHGSVQSAVQIVTELLVKGPAGLVLVTSFSNKPDESHGTFVSDVSALNWVSTDAAPPTLYVRLEDMSLAAIEGWEDLERIEGSRLTWDADVFSPANSGNLVARIPGSDPSRAMILGAHIDSPNSPGAMDDGSGSSILLETARVLDTSQTMPPTDLYLVWFGSEELGLYGSSHFVATHQELLDRTQAMLQTDMLSHPLDGIDADITLVTWSYGRLGDDRLPWPEHLAAAAAEQGVEVVSEDIYHIYSDNSSFGGYDVPHADLVYENEQAMRATGSLHYAAHIHDPYDTVELARRMGDVLEQMARVALAGVLDDPADLAALRVSPRPERRALFVASHTESVHMTPAMFTDVGMVLAMEGFDVDLIPYGQAVTTADLEETDLVFILPVVDYPSPDGDVDLYDEAWTDAEVAALEAYVAGGGLLVLTNSAHRLKYSNTVLEPNEDWGDINAMSERFGISFQREALPAGQAAAEGEHPLMQGVQAVRLIEGNALPFVLSEAHDNRVLAAADGVPAVALVGYGEAGGQVLVLSDLGILGSGPGGPDNLPFWRNLARYAQR